MTFAIIAGSLPCSLFSGNTVNSFTARALSFAEYAGITRKKLKWKRYDNKQLLDEVFVISGILKVEVSVISRGRRLRLITLTKT